MSHFDSEACSLTKPKGASPTTSTIPFPDHGPDSHIPDFLSPDPWSQQQHFGSITPAIDHAGTPLLPHATFGQDLMTFGQTWTDPGAGFAGGPSLNEYDFSFDPALIDALPESIPDFWLVPPPSANTTDASPHTQHQQQQQQEQHQQLESLTLNPSPHPQPSVSSSSALDSITHNTTTTAEALSHSRASSPSSAAASPPPGKNNSSSRAATTSKRDAEDPDVVVKRQRNTIAARKYRQKRLDRIQELEDALKAVTGERDELKLRLARQEAETAALREMMQMRSGKGSD
ncbi:hypothetical protein N0V82_009345 [Gnomoniopsis sp. IMI 355080]|nr:hypothetical protein N0V82_009345 [Gnomoniopsis sp. IMI 355080]